MSVWHITIGIVRVGTRCRLGSGSYSVKYTDSLKMRRSHLDTDELVTTLVWRS